MTYLNKNTIRYFLDLLTVNNEELPYFPREIREIIWEKYFTVNFISCNICNQIILNLPININNHINNEYFVMTNGNLNCFNCKYMDDIFL